MPLPMVHLAVAVEMHKNTEREALPDFLLGSLAPDAIHMRPDSTREDKRRTHLKDWVTPDNYDDIRTFLIGHQTKESQNFAFGYATHVLTDLIWVKLVVHPFRSALPQNTSADDIASIYYQDADQIDVNLYKNQPWRPTVWTQLAQATPIDFAGLLTATEINRWRDRTFNWFTESRLTSNVELDYITDTIVQDFIHQAAQEITNYFVNWNVENR